MINENEVENQEEKIDKENKDDDDGQPVPAAGTTTQDKAGKPNPHDNLSDKDPQTIADKAPAEEEVVPDPKPDAPDAKQVEDNADRNPTN